MQSPKIELRRTAKALGLDVADRLLALADEGIGGLPRFHQACWRRGGVAGRGARATMARRSRGSDMNGVADWLASIGLSEYAQRFADNAIDLSVICDLTEQDLKELGVLLGH